ncbi:MAG: tetratricopeptide repeat protein [Verrucomicrobiota bacterium]|nr:tetratricopeptide repeat protein [Verrucomicrobiota bacterium]
MKGEEKLWAILNEKLDTLSATNQWREAIRVGQSALELAKRTFQPGDVQLAESYEKLGLLHEQNGDRGAAQPYLINALRFLEKLTPPEHSAIFRLARRLGRLSDGLNQFQDAVAFYEKAIAAAANLPDLPCSDLGTLLNNIALTLRKAGQPKAAEPYYLTALQLYEKNLGPEHPDVASVLNNLGVFYTNEKRFTEAEKAHVRALAIREKAFSSSHPDLAQSKCNLAVVFHSRGEYARASELYRESMQVWETTNDALPADYEVVASNYADLLRSLGKARKAQALEERARKRRRG